MHNHLSHQATQCGNGCRDPLGFSWGSCRGGDLVCEHVKSCEIVEAWRQVYYGLANASFSKQSTQGRAANAVEHWRIGCSGVLLTLQGVVFAVQRFCITLVWGVDEAVGWSRSFGVQPAK